MLPTARPRRMLPLAGWVLIASFAGCATTGARSGSSGERPLVPTAFQVRTGSYVICTNNKLEPTAPVVRQLQALEGQVGEALGVHFAAGDHPVEVYILDDRAAFEHFLRFYYPNLPQRRAFFLANGDQRVVYTSFGDRLEEDIRHEATHALLHASVGDIPLWLDEGLAEYFETPDDRRGVNPEHVDRLPLDLAAGWKPDLARLEGLHGVRQMSPRDYREAWAWVHYLLHGGPTEKGALLGYLSDLRASPDARPLSARLDPAATDATMLAHLARIKEAPAVAAAPRGSTVRLQSGPAEPAPPVASATIIVPTTAAPGRRRGVVGRLRDLFGPG